MVAQLIQYAYVSGEISPKLLGRTDLEKYDLGLSLAKNWFVDYRGGLSTRPGQRFCDYVKYPEFTTILHPFQFAPDEQNNYVMMFGPQYVRFLQDGAYVLEEPKAITNIVTGTTTTVTIPAHGFFEGNWIKIDKLFGGRTVQIASVTTDTFILKEVMSLDNIDTTGMTITGASASRIYTVDTPYLSDSLKGLGISQVRDLVRITHFDYPIYNLRRYDHADWRLTQEDLSNTLQVPTGLAGAGIRSGGNTYVFAVTALYQDDEESLASYQVTAGFTGDTDDRPQDYSITYTWDIVPNARAYRVYRGVFNGSSIATLGGSVGLLGRVVGTTLRETNGVPDFTKTPPISRNPFADGRIVNVAISNGGTGYTNSTVIAAVGTGTGFRAIPVVDNSGRLTAVRILSEGKGYGPGTTITASIGSGAVLTAEVSETTGNYPSISARFQQRQIYAATRNEPMNIWASRPGKYSNFDESEVVVDNDPYSFELDSEQIASIKHMVSTRGGLLLMSSVGVWQLSGGNDNAVTATNALASPHTYSGVSDLRPIRIDTDIIFTEAKGGAARMLSFNEYARVYSSEDVSLLSNHFFSLENPIWQWAYAEAPFRVTWGLRDDGSMLAFTFVKEQKVFAWTQNWTKGYYRSIAGIQEGVQDNVYFIVERKVNGRYVKFVELQEDRDADYAEDAWAVDAGLALGANYPEAFLQPYREDATHFRFVSTSPVFTTTLVDDVIRINGGKFYVTEVIADDTVIARQARPFSTTIPETIGEYPYASPGEWTIDHPVTSVGGLYHLEGEMVTILADGNVMPPREVVNGSITLDAPATRVIVGLPFTCVARTLPPTVSDAVIESRRKIVPNIAFRVYNSRGIKAGRALNNLYEIKDRTVEAYGEPIALFTGDRTLLVSTDWTVNSQMYFVQEYPLPATILGTVIDIEVGDDN